MLNRHRTRHPNRRLALALMVPSWTVRGRAAPRSRPPMMTRRWWKPGSKRSRCATTRKRRSQTSVLPDV